LCKRRGLKRYRYQKGFRLPGFRSSGRAESGFRGAPSSAGPSPKGAGSVQKRGQSLLGTVRETEPFGLVWILPSTVRNGEVRLGARPLDSIAFVAG
jgi:hypothetical protein